MDKPVLFLLNPGFFDGDDGPYFCPHNAALEGLLTYVPELREKLDIRYVDFPRPRPALVELLGEAHQGSPALVLPEGESAPEAELSETTGRAFFVGDSDIMAYLHSHFGIMKAH